LSPDPHIYTVGISLSLCLSVSLSVSLSLPPSLSPLPSPVPDPYLTSLHLNSSAFQTVLKNSSWATPCAKQTPVLLTVCPAYHPSLSVSAEQSRAEQSRAEQSRAEQGREDDDPPSMLLSGISALFVLMDNVPFLLHIKINP